MTLSKLDTNKMDLNQIKLLYQIKKTLINIYKVSFEELEGLRLFGFI